MLSWCMVKLMEMPQKSEDYMQNVTLIVVVNMEETILDAVTTRPDTSTRRLAPQHGVLHSTVWRILRVQPYHVQRIQFLQPSDYARRRTFCEWMIEKTNRQLNFLNYLLITDEAGFTKEEILMRVTRINGLMKTHIP
ncbi:hypothetical protein BDFB_010430 [Asbolus verrucosus]|uniref:Uncharacterized protein n=1 Tax=Asbolus verrucosus TaxID=1661398 RepID=A0A482VCT7_ASBVE|nr:hypothetical protein BDFB_010430 [Asbolus verrucosus]